MENEEQKYHLIWVDWARRIISFHEAEGFQAIAYPSHEEMFAFAIDKGFAGFAIQ